MGAEATHFGSSGVVVALATGVAADTVRREPKEATDGVAVAVGRSRKPGGGRKCAESHDEELVTAFSALIEPDTMGDSIGPLLWTSQSIRKITEKLALLT